MIQTESIIINGRQLQRTWSDGDFYIERDGARYSEAVDPFNSGRVYIETDELIEIETDDATIEDYQKALKEFGVEI